MAQQIKELASLPDPGTHMADKKTDSCKLSSDLHRHVMAHVCPYTETHTHNLLKQNKKTYNPPSN